MTAAKTPAAVVVRRATESDSPLLLAWRNDPQTRGASIEQSPVIESDHEAWLHRVLDDPRRILLIGQLLDCEVASIGTCRFDIDQSGRTAEVSITLGAEYRGRALASPLLSAATSHLVEEVPSVMTLSATIRHTNQASQNLFLRHGFAIADSRGGVASYVKKLAQ